MVDLRRESSIFRLVKMPGCSVEKGLEQLKQKGRKQVKMPL